MFRENQVFISGFPRAQRSLFVELQQQLIACLWQHESKERVCIWGKGAGAGSHYPSSVSPSFREHTQGDILDSSQRGRSTVKAASMHEEA